VIEHYVPFGRFKGRLLPEVPQDYLSWFLRECKVSSGLRAAIREELLRRGLSPSALPPAPPPVPPPQCRRCGGRELKLYWQELNGGARTIRADCRRCGRFVGFVAWTAENTARADAAASKAGLLDTLTLAESDGIEVVRRPGGRIDLVPYERVSEELRTLVRQNTKLLSSMLSPTAK
jgi:hypothetical protein